MNRWRKCRPGYRILFRSLLWKLECTLGHNTQGVGALETPQGWILTLGSFHLKLKKKGSSGHLRYRSLPSDQKAVTSHCSVSWQKPIYQRKRKCVSKEFWNGPYDKTDVSQRRQKVWVCPVIKHRLGNAVEVAHSDIFF